MRIFVCALVTISLTTPLVLGDEPKPPAKLSESAQKLIKDSYDEAGKARMAYHDAAKTIRDRLIADLENELVAETMEGKLDEALAIRNEIAKLKKSDFATLVKAQETGGTQLADLAGEWKITYTNNIVRASTIDKDGKVSGTATGQLKQQEGMLLFTYNEMGVDKLERFTLGTDGRLFIEHYFPGASFPDKKPYAIGIGIRQK